MGGYTIKSYSVEEEKRRSPPPPVMTSLSFLHVYRYLTLMGDPTVGKLMASVPRDAQNETVLVPTREAFACVSKAAAALDPEDVSAARRNIFRFFNGIWIHGPENLSPRFWWEYRHCISEMIRISMVLESLELRSFGVQTVTIPDVPQSLPIIGNFIRTECTDAKLSRAETALRKGRRGKRGLDPRVFGRILRLPRTKKSARSVGKCTA